MSNICTIAIKTSHCWRSYQPWCRCNAIYMDPVSKTISFLKSLFHSVLENYFFAINRKAGNHAKSKMSFCPMPTLGASCCLPLSPTAPQCLQLSLADTFFEEHTLLEFVKMGFKCLP
mmetsp:Transcript_5511/g.11447  ORF Transcript_5511/g.11447 Transcript_5511/m.11447 type:complete len:117 (+) Transcript_5511:977-1327(+)